MEQWTQVMDYSFPSAGWSDCHSTFCLSWPRPEEPGLQWLQSLRTHGGAVVTEQLLTWNVKLDGESTPLQLQSRQFFPERVVEVQKAGSLEVVATYSWLEFNTLHVQLLLTNQGSTNDAVDLAYTSASKLEEAATPEGRIPYEAGRRVYYRPPLGQMEGEPEGSWRAVIQFESDPKAPHHPGDQLNAHAYAVYFQAELAPHSFALAAGDSQQLDLVMAFGHDYVGPRRRWEKHRPHAQQWQVSQATARLEKLEAQAPAIIPEFAEQPDLQRLYQQALFGLNSLYIPGEGGFAGTKRIPWTCKHVLAGGFFWDTAFTSVAGALFHPAAAMESIEAFSDLPNERGAMPANLTDGLIGGEGQNPIMAWGAWNIFCQTKDVDWLGRIVHSLEQHVEHWFLHFSRANGMCYIYNSLLGSDDDARYDFCMKGLYNQPVSGVDSPDINAFLVMELKALARMHQVLGDAERARQMEERAEHLARMIPEHFYFAEENAFLDVAEGTRDIMSGVLTPSLFLPLWAEVPLKTSDIQAMIETHMLNPESFYREHPFPSLAYNHPEYDPEGYWRGRIWPHMVFWMCQILWMHGYQEEATTTARNLLRMMLKTPWICENYNSETGIGWSAETLRGWPGYNWCYATVILLLSGAYQRPPLPELER